jgi:Rrf2 family protein
MKISYKLDYALKTLFNLALNYKQNLSSITDLSERLDIPKKFLEQILLELKRGGFVDSKRGNIGGYFLAKAPQEIIVGDVVRYIDGPIEPIECINKEYKGCKDINSCVFTKIWAKVNFATLAIIDNVSLADLIKEHAQTQKIVHYDI